MAPVNVLPHFIKLGKLHSPSNLKIRAEYVEKKYGECMRAQKISDKADKDYAVKSSEFYQRFPSKGFKGFDFESCYLNLFYMVQEMIEELEMHECFTSDEESISDEEESQPFTLPLSFDFERGLTYKGKSIQITNEDGDDDSSDEGERSEHRPISRLSLEVDETYDSTVSDCDSDYYFGESEGEDDDFKKVIYGPVPGVAVGDVWKTRRECSKSLVHIPCKSRIHCGSSAGCSIVLSSKEMVDDEGVLFTYKNKAKLDKSDNTMAHQLIGGNKALQNNFWKRAPIRVIRSYQLGNRFAPKKGYRYDGLYDVENITYGGIKNGYQYCKVTLVRCPNQPPPPWAKSNAPAGYVPGHLLSTTEIDYTTGDCAPPSSDDKRNPAPLRSATENSLNSRSNRILTVVLKRLSQMEIEKATNMVCSPKEAVKKSSYLQQQIHCEETKNSEMGSNKPGRSKMLVSAKFSKSSEKTKQLLMKQRNAAAKLNSINVEKKNSSALLLRDACSPKRKRTVSLSYEVHNKEKIKSKSENKGRIIKNSKELQGSPTMLNSKNDKSSNKPIADISKNHDLRNKGTSKSANISFLKQKIIALSSYSQKGKSLDEKKIAPGAKKMAMRHSSTNRRLPEIKQRSKSGSVISHNKKQKLAQAKRGNAKRKRGRKEL